MYTYIVIYNGHTIVIAKTAQCFMNSVTPRQWEDTYVKYVSMTVSEFMGTGNVVVSVSWTDESNESSDSVPQRLLESLEVWMYHDDAILRV